GSGTGPHGLQNSSFGSARTDVRDSLDGQVGEWRSGRRTEKRPAVPAAGALGGLLLQRYFPASRRSTDDFRKDAPGLLPQKVNNIARRFQAERLVGYLGSLLD